MGYLVATKQSLLNKETFKFVKYHPDAGLDIQRPFYMYEDRVTYPSNEKRTTVVELNKLWIAFSNADRWYWGDSSADIMFTDKNRLSHAIRLDVQHNTTPNDVTIYWRVEMEGKGGKTEQGQMVLGKPFQGEIAFQYIPGLGRQYTAEMKDNKLHYGVRQHQYGITYQGRTLRGACYAMLCGMWAVLLDDDMSFDALVMLNKAQSGSLGIERILYTDNPYLLKMKMLLG